MDLSQRGLYTIDLLPVLSSLSSDRLDTGYDGSHFGPKASDVIADVLGAALSMRIADEDKIPSRKVEASRGNQRNAELNGWTRSLTR